MYKYRFRDYLRTIYTKMRITIVISSPRVNDMKKTWEKNTWKQMGELCGIIYINCVSGVLRIKRLKKKWVNWEVETEIWSWDMKVCLINSTDIPERWNKYHWCFFNYEVTNSSKEHGRKKKQNSGC